MKDVSGKVALITGGSRGMGFEFAKILAGKGAKLAIVDINEDALTKAVGELKKTGVEVYGEVCDITDEAAVKALAVNVHKKLGPVDILDNNAGIVSGGALLDVPYEKHLRTIDVNINSIMLMTHTFLPDMIGKGEGYIVNMASSAGLMGVPSMTSYCASKHAAVGFSEALQVELLSQGHKNILVTAVCPSYVDTGMFAGVKAPKGTRMLTAEGVAKKTYKSMVKGKKLLIVPTLAKGGLFSKFLSARSLYFLERLLNVDNSMKGWTGREKK